MLPSQTCFAGFTLLSLITSFGQRLQCFAEQKEEWISGWVKPQKKKSNFWKASWLISFYCMWKLLKGLDFLKHSWVKGTRNLFNPCSNQVVPEAKTKISIVVEWYSIMLIRYRVGNIKAFSWWPENSSLQTADISFILFFKCLDAVKTQVFAFLMEIWTKKT